jgi:hypothetical protein
MLSLVSSLPFALIVSKGHLGASRWQLPSPGAFVYLIWHLGLGPSLVVVNPASERLTFFTEDAVTIARVVYCAWFAAYALALGGAKAAKVVDEPIVQLEDPRRASVGFWVVACLCVATTLVAARYDMLSAWGNSSEGLAAKGSAESGGGLLYFFLMKILVPVAILMRLKGTAIDKRVSIWAIVAGFALLFVYSQRRLWVVIVYLCMFVPFVSSRKLNFKWLVTMLVVGTLGLGPLVWAYREVRTSGRSEDAPTQAVESALSYATDSSVRSTADRSAVALDTRLNISSVLMGTVEYVLRTGPKYTPSFLSGVLIEIPTVIWPGKSDVAEPIKARSQLVASGHFMETDIPVSPITEFVLQLGPMLGWIGGAIYGYLARLCTLRAASAQRSLPKFIVWTTFVTNLALFDSGTDAIVGIREMILVVLAVVVASEAFAWVGSPRAT